MRYDKNRTNIGKGDKVTKEEEQAMMQELAEFIFRFGEKYDVLLDIKVKPRKVKQNRGDVL